MLPMMYGVSVGWIMAYGILGGYISWQPAHPSQRLLIVIIAALLLFSSININKFLCLPPSAEAREGGFICNMSVTHKMLISPGEKYHDSNWRMKEIINCKNNDVY